MGSRRAFTLVEILIVVVILGILAAIVIPQFANVSSDTQRSATYYELQKLRKAIGVYRVRNSDAMPLVTAGDGTWGPLVGRGDYMLAAPTNAWVGTANAKAIVLGTGPDTSYHTNYGWIFDASTGDVWAAGFDGQDNPLPRP